MDNREFGSLTDWGIITDKYGNKYISDAHVEAINSRQRVIDIDSSIGIIEKINNVNNERIKFLKARKESLTKSMEEKDDSK